MKVVVLALGLASLAAPAFAQLPKSPAQVVNDTHAAFRMAKNPAEVQSIEDWCSAGLATFSFQERDRLMVEADRLLQANQIDAANSDLARVRSLKELNSNLAAISCVPDSFDKAAMSPQARGDRP